MRWLAGLVAMVLSATASADAPLDRRIDEHSYAGPAKVRVKHVALDLRVDFTAKQLAGTATLELDWAKPSDQLVLDTRDLVIAKVEGLGAKWLPLPFALGKRDPILGSP